MNILKQSATSDISINQHLTPNGITYSFSIESGDVVTDINGVQLCEVLKKLFDEKSKRVPSKFVIDFLYEHVRK